MKSEQLVADLPKFDSAARDRLFWETIDSLYEENELTLQDVLRHYPAYFMRRDLPRVISHYELFKKVVDLPGCIVELGVWYGTSFFTWAKLLETFCPYDRSRKVIGFDNFEGLQNFSPQDGPMDTTAKKEEGGYKSPAQLVRTLVKLHNADNVIPGTQRAMLIEGDLAESIPRFLKEYPGLRISLLHFDVDLYEPTKVGLEHLYPLVLKGGVVAFDEYALVPWQGETTAVDEYFKKIGEQPQFKKHPFAQTPHGYFIK